jgi:hypothetical protein
MCPPDSRCCRPMDFRCRTQFDPLANTVLVDEQMWNSILCKSWLGGFKGLTRLAISVNRRWALSTLNRGPTEEINDRMWKRVQEVYERKYLQELRLLVMSDQLYFCESLHARCSALSICGL